MLILLAKASSILPRQETSLDANVQVDEISDEGLPLEFDVPAEDLVADQEE
jgi:hypothetical protein